MPDHDPHCPLCLETGGAALWRDDDLRVVEVEEPHYPGYTRVIWNRHVAEMTDLSAAQRDHVMRVVWEVERAQRAELRPDKINVASLGNMVAHVHWHIIPRWREDRHFPDAIWATPRFAADGAPAQWRERLAALQARRQPYRDRLLQALQALPDLR
jgi:diadenosine tetraphosphate (Ap4A) HIT family hydrolase